ncbi:MAG: XdhC family protein [Bacteriovoracaceae bacterium]
MSLSFSDYVEKFQELSSKSIPYVVVTLLQSKGSAPQDPGAKMIVTQAGLYFGTVGGGKVETKAIKEAQKMLEDREAQSYQYFEWNLQKDVGMTCGGAVSFSFELSKEHPWQVAIFGAGHIAQELVRLMLNFKCELNCFDNREEWLAKLPDSPHLKKIHSNNLPEEILKLSPTTFVVLMTMGHGTDSPIMLSIFKNKKEFPFLGIIGSLAKRNVLEKDLRDHQLEQFQKSFICPLGLPIGDNSPVEIALSIAAQLIEKRDHYFKTAKRSKSFS